jgi:hypothetical protein
VELTKLRIVDRIVRTGFKVVVLLQPTDLLQQTAVSAVFIKYINRIIVPTAQIWHARRTLHKKLAFSGAHIRAQEAHGQLNHMLL